MRLNQFLEFDRLWDETQGVITFNLDKYPEIDKKLFLDFISMSVNRNNIELIEINTLKNIEDDIKEERDEITCYSDRQFYGTTIFKRLKTIEQHVLSKNVTNGELKQLLIVLSYITHMHCMGLK